MANLLEQFGAQPQKQPHYAPIFQSKQLTGLYTQRSVLHDPSDIITEKYYGGRPDALLAGLNVELTNRLTLARRPGTTEFSTATYPTVPDRAFSFQLTNGTIQVLFDCGSTNTLNISSVANSSGGTAVYTGVFPNAGANRYVGMAFNVAGFAGPTNNGFFTCVASTTTTLTLSNSMAVAETPSGGATAISSGAIWLDNQNGTKTLVFAKGVGAGQAYGVPVGNVLYIGDGVDLVKYTPLNTTGTYIWNYSIAAPTTQPNVDEIPSGSAATAWVANTVFSTMGFIVDPNGNTQQLYSVNVLGTNATQLGTTGNGAPAFNTATGATTNDGSVVWTSQGQIGLWAADTSFLPGQCIYDPTTECLFIMSHTSSRTSGPTRPAFNSTLGLSGARVDDTNGSGTGGGNATWENIGKVSNPPTAVLIWAKNTAFSTYVSPKGGVGDPTNTDSAIVYPLVPSVNSIGQLNGGQATYLIAATTGGTTANTNYTPWTGIPSQIVGDITEDNQIAWVCLGSATRQNNTQYTAWTTGSFTFSAIEVSGTMYVCTTGGDSAASAPTFVSTYGAVTNDGSVQWTSVGPAMSWAVNTQWYLPAVGFSPPQPSQQYGGAEVVGSGYVQTVISSGLSGGSAPAWSTTVGNTTTDNGITWETVSQYSAQSLSWTKGYVYAYSFKARTLTDPYSPAPLGGGDIPPGVSVALGAPTGSQTGGISTASPVFTITGSNTGSVNVVTGLGSTDPQVDTIVIWRSADGGSSDQMFELTEIPAPKPINGVAQPWSFSDTLPDLPSATEPGLNDLIPAPIDDSNDPPPAGFLPMAYHFQRIWGSVGQYVYFSGGPDILTGNPNEAYNPADEFEFLSTVTRLVHTPVGLVTFLQSDIEMIYGGPQTASFYNTTLVPGVGMLSYNALDFYGGEIYFFSSDSRLMVLTPSLNVSDAGFPIGDKLAQFYSPSVYVAVQQAGTDNAIYVTDGSQGWYRLNPHQVPQNEAIWSPYAQITGGLEMLQSVQVSPGVRKLLIGGTLPNMSILERNLTVFTDNGSPYNANFTIGSIVLAHPGQLAVLKFIEGDFTKQTTQPLVSYLLDEIGNTLFQTTNTVPSTGNVFDPPSQYGVTLSPNSYWPLRYYLSQNQSVARCKHMQIAVTYSPTSTVQDELISFCVYGRLYNES